MRFQKLIITCLVCTVFFSCRKEFMQPENIPATELRANSSVISLWQSNAASAAVQFSWMGRADDLEMSNRYTLEIAIAGTQFSNALELVTTDQLSVTFTVQEFNEQLRKMIMAGVKELIECRVRINTAQAPPRYSNVVTITVTAYQPYSVYDEAQILRLPGNYQDWTVASAPRIISPKRDGQFEGFALFTDAHSQFYLVKGTQWDNVTTYNQTGPNSFGFNGTFFFVPGGAGINRVNVNMNTYTWSCTKINSFGLYGTATGNTDATMVCDASTLSWNITRDLAKGEFLFRADRSNEIVFGHNEKSGVGVADSDGEKISIPRAGNYTIALFLGSAGNYSYGIRRNK